MALLVTVVRLSLFPYIVNTFTSEGFLDFFNLHCCGILRKYLAKTHLIFQLINSSLTIEAACYRFVMLVKIKVILGRLNNTGLKRLE